MRGEQMRVVDEVLEELGASGKERLTVFNKIDLLPVAEQAELLTTDGDYVRITAYSDADLARLLAAVQEKLLGESRTFRVPADKGDIISLVYRIGDVIAGEVEGDDMRFQVRVNKDDYAKMGYLLAAYDEARQAEQQRGES
jgi:GTP-binding protein HflX